MLPYIKDSNGTFTAVVNNKPYQFDSSHAKYTELMNFVATGDVDGFLSVINVGKAVEKWSEETVQKQALRLVNGVLYYGEEVIHDSIATRVIDCMKEGFPYENYENFLGRLYSNPSYRAVQQLYTFLVHKNLPITPDGYIIMWKAVRPNFNDKWTDTISNAPGQKPSMPRNKVEDNPDIYCGPGLHAGSLQFVKDYGSQGDHVMMLKVDPANVVSIPRDANCQKVRTCGYEVISEYETDILGAVHNPQPVACSPEAPAGTISGNSPETSGNALDKPFPIAYNGTNTTAQVNVDGFDGFDDDEDDQDEFDDDDSDIFDDDDEDDDDDDSGC